MPASDSFSTVQTSFEGPARNAEAVTPDDDTDLTNVSRALWVGTGGDVVVTMQGGDTVTFANVPDGSLLPIAVSRVKATNTTAADMVALS